MKKKKDTKAKTKDMFGFRRKKYVKGLSIKKKGRASVAGRFSTGCKFKCARRVYEKCGCARILRQDA